MCCVDGVGTTSRRDLAWTLSHPQLRLNNLIILDVWKNPRTHVDVWCHHSSNIVSFWNSTFENQTLTLPSYSDGMISVLELGTYLSHQDPRNFADTRTLNSIRDVPNSRSPWIANLAYPFIHGQCNFQRTKNSVGANRTRKNGNWQKRRSPIERTRSEEQMYCPHAGIALYDHESETDWILFFRVLRNLTEEWMMKCSVTQTRRTKKEKQKSCCWCLQNHPLPVGKRYCVRRNQITKKLCQHLTYNKTQCDNTFVHHRVITWAVNELVTLDLFR